MSLYVEKDIQGDIRMKFILIVILFCTLILSNAEKWLVGFSYLPTIQFGAGILLILERKVSEQLTRI